MSPKVFAGWAVAAALAIVAATAAVLARPETATVKIDNAPVFAALHARPEAVARIVIKTADGSFALHRGADGRWRVADKYDYPADATKVRDLVVGLADLKLVEPKTRRPELYPRLEVEDVDAPKSKSRLVRVEDKDGKALAEAIIGKRRFRYTGGATNGVYIRRPGEAQAWLASGRAKVEPQLLDWLDQTVVNVARETVARVAIEPSKGPAYAAARDDADASFRIEGLKDVKLNPDTDDRLSGVLAYVDFDDVKPVDKLTWPADAKTARVTTFDGVEISVRLARIDDADWATVSARVVDPPVAGKGDAKAARKQADKINARTKGWAYRLPGYVVERLTRPRDALIEDKPTS